MKVKTDFCVFFAIAFSLKIKFCIQYIIRFFRSEVSLKQGATYFESAVF